MISIVDIHREDLDRSYVEFVRAKLDFFDELKWFFFQGRMNTKGKSNFFSEEGREKVNFKFPMAYFLKFWLQEGLRYSV